ncbi:MAG: (2Fe-2S)-binding protein [Turicibacter sp.]|nr:(2Fe-2S)-binding protein [Turicibacter sp.]
MPGPIICTTNTVDYSTIRQSLARGSRTKEDLKNDVNVCLECEGCHEKLDRMLTIVCTCFNVTFDQVREAIAKGADTEYKIGQATNAGTDCGRCRSILASILEKGH